MYVSRISIEIKCQQVQWLENRHKLTIWTVINNVNHLVDKQEPVLVVLFSSSLKKVKFLLEKSRLCATTQKQPLFSTSSILQQSRTPIMMSWFADGTVVGRAKMKVEKLIIRRFYFEAATCCKRSAIFVKLGAEFLFWRLDVFDLRHLLKFFWPHKVSLKY